MPEAAADPVLLQRYVAEKSQAAFAALVERHLDLVYGVALRQVNGDTHLAQDVTQSVFTALARKAPSLADRPVLGGWLYRTAQFAAIDALRVESRRRAREQQAQLLHELTMNTGGAPDWDRLRPTLDQAIGELNDADRDAIVLRFFEGKTFAAMGERLGLPENTARMRVERALAKLGALLARRGVTSTTAALAVALAESPAIAAPAGFAATVTGAALSGSAAAVAGAGTAGGLFAFMSTGKIALGVALVAAAAGLGAAWLAGHDALEAQTDLAAATAQQATWRAKLADTESRLAAETRRAQQAESENHRLLAAADATKSAPATAAPEEPITNARVQARFRHAQELAKNGDPAEALRELLWCYDIGMVQIPAMVGVRHSFAVSVLAQLADRYEPARQALQERAEKYRQAVLADSGDFEDAMAFGAINRALQNNAATLAVLDQLPAGDGRRSTLEGQVQDDLISARRYADALEGHGWGQISANFERVTASDSALAKNGGPEGHQFVLESTGQAIEVLAGAGDIAHARVLATRLLAWDSADSTRALIQQHATRAGQPDLLASPTP